MYRRGVYRCGALRSAVRFERSVAIVVRYPDSTAEIKPIRESPESWKLTWRRPSGWAPIL